MILRSYVTVQNIRGSFLCRTYWQIARLEQALTVVWNLVPQMIL